MKYSFIFQFTFLMSSAASFAGGFPVHVGSTSACLMPDGTPLGGPAAATCCDLSLHFGKGSDPSTCPSGFGGITLETVGAVAQELQLAATTLRIANEMSGNTSDLTGAKTIPGGPGSGVAPDTSAVTAGGNSGVGANGTGNLSGNLPGMNAVSGGNGAGSGSGAGAGGGGGSGLGSADGGSGSKSALSGDLLASKDPTDKGYVGNTPGAAGGSGAAGKVNTDGLNELHFGGPGGNDPSAANGNAAGDEDGTGSPTDPSDYFNRIDKSASIFKVVSARYGKKKSLWQPQASVQPNSNLVPVIKR